MDLLALFKPVNVLRLFLRSLSLISYKTNTREIDSGVNLV